ATSRARAADAPSAKGSGARDGAQRGTTPVVPCATETTGNPFAASSGPSPRPAVASVTSTVPRDVEGPSGAGPSPASASSARGVSKPAGGPTSDGEAVDDGEPGPWGGGLPPGGAGSEGRPASGSGPTSEEPVAGGVPRGGARTVPLTTVGRPAPSVEV